MPVKGRRRGVKVGMEIDVGSKEVFGRSLDTMMEQGSLRLGVGEAGKDLVGEAGKGAEFVLKELLGKSRAAHRLAQDAEAGCAFGGRRKERESMVEDRCIGGRQKGERRRTRGGGEKFRLR